MGLAKTGLNSEVVLISSGLNSEILLYLISVYFVIKYTEFFVEKMREAVALQKFLNFFSTKILAYLRSY